MAALSRWSTSAARPKQHRADDLQLCGQAMCLEEMLCCEIPEGALFYGEIRRRLDGVHLRRSCASEVRRIA